MLLSILAVVLVIAGLVGIIVPGLPGTALVFAGLCLAAWADGFSRVGVATLVLIGVLAAATYLVDLAAMALGMKRIGASRRAMLGATLGMMFGFFFGLPGLILGPFAGAVAGELTAHRDLARAGRIGLAAWMGFIVGTAVKVALAFVIIGIFLTAWLI